jgi:hypothetical protein
MTNGKPGPCRWALLLSYSAVLAFQALWHWFLTTDQASARALLGFYIHRPHSGPPPDYILDLFIPGAAIGLLMGWIGRRSPFRQLWLYILLFGLGIGAARLLFDLFLDTALLRWWPQSAAEWIAHPAVVTINAWPVIAIFASAGRALGVKSRGGSSGSASDSQTPPS